MADIEGLKAKDIMQSRVIKVGADDPLDSVHRLFCDEEISGAPVVGDTGELLGVVTIRDLLTARREAIEDPADSPTEMGFFRDGVYEESQPQFVEDSLESLSQLTARDVMSPEVISIDPDTPVSKVASTIVENQIHRVLVVEQGAQGNNVLGIVSLLDLVMVLA